MIAGAWRRVTRSAPCPVCGRGDWCAWTADGFLKCERAAEPPSGFRLAKRIDGGALFAPVGDDRATHWRNGVKPDRPARDWAADAERFRAALTPARRDELAATLNVLPAALDSIGVGWASADELRAMHAGGAGWGDDPPDGAYTFSERDGSGRIVGLSLRATDGRKGAPRGSSRGLIVPASLATRADPVLVVEGASDVAALESLGLAAVGRPSNAGGAEEIARLLTGRDVLVVGERDQKPTGAWPGRDGAQRVAERLAAAWGAPVAWALPPDGAKDVRAWLGSRVDAGLDLADATACAAAGQELLSALRAVATAAKPERRPSQAESIVRLAHELFRIGRSDSDEPFAVRRDGPNIAITFRGSRDALRATLAREYRARYRATPTAATLADALTALSGDALDCDAEPLALRVGESDRAIVLDLGRADGRVAVIRAGAWELCDESPILFRRTALTGELPIPERGGELSALRDLLNVDDSDFALLLGWAVAAFLPAIPHPILLLGGEHGTAKSSAARFIVGMFDPSPAVLRSQPTDAEAWAIAAAGSWAVALDNVSHLPGWLSDALCKAVTGDGWIRRRLYSDSELAVLAFRRVVALTSIDAGALRGDLGDRLVRVELERIPDARRRPESEIRAAFVAALPKLLGALLDLLAGVLARLPDVRLAEMPRMADFARVLAAMDAELGTDALPQFVTQRDTIARDVLDGDAVGAAIGPFLESRGGSWTGTPSELHAALSPERLPADWPKRANALSGRLKRLAPSLRAVGIDVIVGERTGRDRSRAIRCEIVPERSSASVASSASPTSNGTARPSGDPTDGAADDPRTIADDPARKDRPHVRGSVCAPVPADSAAFQRADDADDRDDHFAHTYEDCPEADGGERDEWGGL